MRTLASRYGAGPGHLVGHLLLFLLAAWAIAQVVEVGGALEIAVWFVGAALLHDLVVLPLYTVLDRGLIAGLRARRPPRSPARTRLVNHVRVPLALAAVLLLVSYPLATYRAPGNIERVAGFVPSGYGTSYLVIVAVLAVGSALLYLVRRVRAGRSTAH